MFFDKYKEKSAHKILRKGSQAVTGRAGNGNSKVSSLACVVNLDEFEDVEAFSALAGDLGVKQEHFAMIGYTTRRDADAFRGIPVFTAEELGWKGKIRNDHYRQVSERPYDMLLSYYCTSAVLLGLATLGIRAGFKVGFAGMYERENDLIMNMSPERFPEFREELIKYLTILNKI